ncbi:putative MFS family arabinose efflux permease [Kushneria sinocarnis]|uniref:Putative MFS family arabinose efflux permease n=1 Tax=Kushneria sinocarnis TaxID=595502 RepID=A0A420WZW5_9GAMM|nr:MFS transporter [Kushneria sinocarnis]RKR06807.1 putative MFS family arabinose efflux permease [Kushneria sinocarnis]
MAAGIAAGDGVTAQGVQGAVRANGAVFLGCGIATACWAPMVPMARERLAIGDGTLGLILLALGAGGMLMMPLSGLLVRRFGSRHVVVLAGLSPMLLLPLLAVAPTALTLALALFLFGALIGALDVSMNAQAVTIESAAERSRMATFHGLFSLGGLIGAGLMSLLIGLGLPLVTIAALCGTAITLMVLAGRRRLLSDPPSAAGSAGFSWPRGAVVLLGVLCLIAFLAEGAVLDWSAVFLRYSRDASPALAGMGYGLFSLTMAVGRLNGDRLIRRFGPVPVLRYGALLAALGYGVALLAPWPPAALGGFMLVGLGLSNLVPVLFSAAGRVPDMSPGLAISAVSTLGYAGLLAGPAVLGLVSELTSLAMALALIAVALLGVMASAGRVVRR